MRYFVQFGIVSLFLLGGFRFLFFLPFFWRGGGGFFGEISRNLESKRGTTEDFGRIQREDHSNLLGK